MFKNSTAENLQDTSRNYSRTYPNSNPNSNFRTKSWRILQRKYQIVLQILQYIATDYRLRKAKIK